MAQRGFAGMGAAPQRGESSLAALGRTVASPLAQDMSTIAGQLMPQRAAIKAAREQEERQLKLAALQGVRGRQQATYATDVAAEEKARALIMNEKKKGGKIRTDLTIGGENKPVIVRTDAYGEITVRDFSGTALDLKKVGVYDSNKGFKPVVHKIDGIQKKVDDKWVGLPVTSMITFDKENGLMNTTPRLFETGTKSMVPVKVDGINYRMKPDADKIRSGKLIEKVTFSATVDGNRVTGVGPVNLVTTPEGVETRTVGKIKAPTGEVIPANSLVDSWKKFETPGEGRKSGQEFGQYILPNGQMSPVVKIDTVTSWDSNNQPVTTYSTVVKGRSINIPLAEYRPFTQLNEPYKREPTPYTVSVRGDLLKQLSNVSGMGGVKAGDKIELYRALPIKDKGGTEQKELRFKGRKVEIPKELLDKATQTSDLSQVQRRDFGLDVSPKENWAQGNNLTLDLDAVKIIRDAYPGYDVNQGEVVQVLYDRNNPATRKYFFKDKELKKSIIPKLLARPLSKVQRIAAGLDPTEKTKADWRRGKPLKVTLEALATIDDAYPNLKATVNEEVQVLYDQNNPQGP